MIHSLYKTVNNINGKFYIGMHTSGDPNDDYLGSGTAIKAAIKKYGKENFTKEVLKICETRTELEHFEKLYVDSNLDDPNCYNLKEGGQGGWDHTWNSEKRLEAIAKSFEEGRSKGWQLDKAQRSEMFSGENNGFHGMTHTKDARAKIGKAKETPKEIEEQRVLQFQAEPKTWGWKGRLGKLWGISPQKVAPWLKHRGYE